MEKGELFFFFFKLPFVLLVNNKAVWDIVIESMERRVEKSVSF